jgi:hypothetical protein
MCTQIGGECGEICRSIVIGDNVERGIELSHKLLWTKKTAKAVCSLECLELIKSEASGEMVLDAPISRMRVHSRGMNEVRPP